MSELEKLRIDKWLWAARFYKTRSIASDAVNGGKVHLNNERVKAAKAVKVGDVLKIRKGNDAWTVRIVSLFEKRRQASLAQTMYEETEESIKQREEGQASRRAMNAGMVATSRRPSKKDRRHIIRFKREKQRGE